ncbi:protein of unknown function [Taphrina deformans PYCC 5710]|uniref:Cyclase n=1 Tax=Taphrina deformans (strain PYCC 5710 / ATCC 11124 / CBS 356.35 / IMI 108563 / JCM 9778 / NBRC 8474) TaxID=1097556 RepID=R4XE59_TAPDE|nr:protein of unknown function [Taphrina deformans PYCC 5710]|eukprot:CCG84090.1 protein of unknown function [Taphrina deformans PYCC 5710]
MSDAANRVKQLAASLVSSFSDDSGLPDYKDLPTIPGTTYKCAWGLFDKDGHRDEVGTLNLLTPERVLKASRSEILTGQSVSLNWGLENVKFPGFGRKPMSQKIIRLDESSLNWCGHDDELSFNTQCGSQWDGLRHAAHQRSKKYYNALSHEDLIAGKDVRNGLEAVNDRGGVCGRGVLLDWVAFAQRHNIKYDPITTQKIPLSDLQACAREQGVQFQVGDILFIRSGFVKWHNQATDAERKAGTQDAASYIGVESSEEMFEWHWNSHFSAVVGDTVAYESWPPAMFAKGYDENGPPMLHEVLLASYGMLIGEMWDLEALADKCKELGRYSFFVTSAPLNVKGGIGSPPNALAIF